MIGGESMRERECGRYSETEREYQENVFERERFVLHISFWEINGSPGGVFNFDFEKF